MIGPKLQEKSKWWGKKKSEFWDEKSKFWDKKDEALGHVAKIEENWNIWVNALKFWDESQLYHIKPKFLKESQMRSNVKPVRKKTNV